MTHHAAERGYGTFEVRRHDNGTVIVVHADPRILVNHENLEFLDQMKPGGTATDGLLVLDTAGHYRYRPTAFVPLAGWPYVGIICERIHPSPTTAPDQEGTPRAPYA